MPRIALFASVVAVSVFGFAFISPTTAFGQEEGKENSEPEPLNDTKPQVSSETNLDSPSADDESRSTLPKRGGPPAARTGFQMMFRSGYSVPMGKVSGLPNANMSDVFGGQVPIMIDIGAKPIPHLFVGAYLGTAFGGGEAPVCNQPDASCAKVNFRLGAQLQVHILPGRLVNPWLGYGAGLESVASVTTYRGQESSSTTSGWEYAHLMGGVDFRLHRVIGFGPYIDFSAGTYSSFTSKASNGVETSRDINPTATHHWLTVGVRGTLFP